ncbi:type VII secretion protein EssC [Bacillus arachidis]|uniref:type VII secretion protein EssC n=1 Tax=Bacillus arachidis TaxID=2819290 RepID=UPI00255CABCE|nr:type VII secretion protein EssC [Bacillus arachidis]WIY63150.1 type VII secretion protein EssC [Bacillus arachidis]
MQKSPYFQRSPRMKVDIPTGNIVIHDPPNIPEEPKFSIETIILPAAMTLLTFILYFVMMKVMKMNSSYLPLMLVSSIPMLGSYIFTGMGYIRNRKEHRQMVEQLKTRYLEQIQKHRVELDTLKVEQAKYLITQNPSPLKSVQRIENRESNLWERTPESPDFLDIRIGTGSRPFLVELKVPEQRGYEENTLVTEAQNVKRDFTTIPNGHISISLKKNDVIGVVGNKEDRLNFIRTVTTQIMTHHAPNEVKIAAFYHEREKKQWDWMRWLPHVWDEQRSMRFLAENEQNAQKLAESLFTPLNMRRIYNSSAQADEKVPLIPMYIFFLSAREFLEDDPLIPMLLREGKSVGASTFVFAEQKERLPMECDIVISLNGENGELVETFSNSAENSGTTRASFKVDRLSFERCELGARSIAPIRMKSSTAANIPKVLTFLDLFQVKKMEELQVLDRWNENRYPTSLPVPIGVREGSKPVFLNIHDKIEKKGHGPHGLMAGTTGSGKSEVIQSIIAALAVTYHPHEMAFMLIDYKGGGMSNTFSGLPHIIASITNLEDPNLIERARISLKAELERRQKLFIQAGNVQHLDEYYETTWREKEPLPHLFIVIDEFAQMKKEQPEFMDELISVAAIGRTLGVHLLLATQKPSGVVNDKIWSNSRFRICLRVQDDADSREMLKIPDASKINVPGRGYLQVGSNEILELFQSAWSGAPYSPDEEKVVAIVDFTEVKLSGKRIKVKKRPKPMTNSPKQLQAFIRYIQTISEKENIKPLPGPWLAPLPEKLLLNRFYEIENWNMDLWKQREEDLQLTVGLIDDVANQAQYPLKLDLQEGHLNIYGMPGTGKTTLLQTIIMSLALSHTPEEVNFYVVDFGRMFLDFRDLPHVGGIVQEDEIEKMKRLFSFLRKEVTYRKECFSDMGAKSFAMYNRMVETKIPAIVIMIDGYIRFRSEYEKENEILEQLLRESSTYGIYFYFSLNQTTDMFDRVRNNIPMAISFELQDRTEYYSLVGRPNFPLIDVPSGRGLTKGQPPELFQAALPFIGENELEYSQQLKTIIQKMDRAWNGEKAKAIPMVPKELFVEEVLEQSEPSQICVGIETEDIRLQSFSLEEMTNIFIGGRIEGGKTSLLQTLIFSLTYQYAPEEIELIMIDLSERTTGILALGELPHVKKRITDDMQLKELLDELLEIINSRDVVTPPLNPNEKIELPYSRIMIVIDDIDQILALLSVDFDAKNKMEQIVQNGRNKGIHFITAATTSSVNSYSHEKWFAEIRKRSFSYLLGTTQNNDLYFFNIKLPHVEMDRELSSGEGYFVRRKQIKIKCAFTPLHLLQDLKQKIARKWIESTRRV